MRLRHGSVGIRALFIVLTVVTMGVGTGAVQARPLRERLDPHSLCRSGLYTDRLGHLSTVAFETPRACDLYIRNGGTLYPLPSASWSQRIHVDPAGEGSTVTWCDAVLTVLNLDPSSTYTANVSFHSTVRPPLSSALNLVVNGKGVGSISTSFEECVASGETVTASATVVDASGAVVATAGPTSLFP